MTSESPETTPESPAEAEKPITRGLHIGFGATSRELTRDWNVLLKTSGNPLGPPFGETLEAALTADEASRLEAHLRPLVEAGRGSSRMPAPT